MNLPALRARAKLLAIVPLLVLDCFGSWCIGESPRATLSAKAYDVNVNKHPHNAWTRGFIDRLFKFQPDHCKVQWEREQAHGGSVWAAWADDWRTARGVG